MPPDVLQRGTARKSTNQEGASGVRTEFLDGLNAGKTSTTDNNGAYCINQVSPGGFTVRASCSGYQSSDQSVTISANVGSGCACQGVGATKELNGSMPTLDYTPVPLPARGRQ